ncbi:flagellar biosynthetic protein FliP [Kordiimonas sediminis]|uniref:Flagellar biosynthetic protein FliP n=1 Tax=Kordiimonas sediminis TaxID=1735581 RepID=A0A919E7R7_9PROT|nr:flagellar type III secretion system pore protein FliP [Kordiimonas sediminis]GHF27031.1 flagellar biosynthetic protein FliP [Kordiimonas sediminis]
MTKTMLLKMLPSKKERCLFLLGLLPAAIIACTFIYAPEAAAQSLTLDLGESGSLTGRVVQMLLLLTVLSLAPSILVMMTSFTRIIVVLSLLRSALGTQQTPPNIVLISLALFLTGYVMSPTLTAVWDTGIQPLINEEIDEQQAYDRSIVPMRAFMMSQVREKDLELFQTLREAPVEESLDEIPLTSLIPAFMISELRRAFEIGFLLYVPFLVLDMVIASVLMSMGMMMLPPVMIALPFKLIFFVLVDGWNLVAGSLVQSFGTSPPPGIS